MQGDEDRGLGKVYACDTLIGRGIGITVAQETDCNVSRLQLLTQLSGEEKSQIFLQHVRRDTRSHVASTVRRIDDDGKCRRRRTSRDLLGCRQRGLWHGLRRIGRRWTGCIRSRWLRRAGLTLGRRGCLAAARDRWKLQQARQQQNYE